jgi:hypothetical protein
MKKIEDEGLDRVIVHAIDAAIYNLGIRLTNDEWCYLIGLLDVLFSLEV